MARASRQVVRQLHGEHLVVRLLFWHGCLKKTACTAPRGYGPNEAILLPCMRRSRAKLALAPMLLEFGGSRCGGEGVRIRARGSCAGQRAFNVQKLFVCVTCVVYDGYPRDCW